MRISPIPKRIILWDLYFALIFLGFGSIQEWEEPYLLLVDVVVIPMIIAYSIIEVVTKGKNVRR